MLESVIVDPNHRLVVVIFHQLACGLKHTRNPPQFDLRPRATEAVSAAQPQRKPKISPHHANSFLGLQTNKSTGEVSFSVKFKELTAAIGSKVVLRARVAASTGASQTVIEAVSQPFGIM
jgi:hypothetical protein